MIRGVVVVLGGSGMLGHDLVSACSCAGIATRSLHRPAFDITDSESIAGQLIPGSVVVNCAAYTHVDDAETHREIAFSVNGVGAGMVARACYENDCRLIQISSNYVFNGQGNRPYHEEDPTDPVNTYGASKLEGERLVAQRLENFLIVRTQSLFGRNGRHFVSAICRKLDAGASELRVVNDQICSPTNTKHLAGAILTLLQSEHTGHVHVSASGQCSWYDFVIEIVRQVKPGVVVHPVHSEEYPLPARRPSYAVLDNSRFQLWTGSTLPSWEEGLADYGEYE